MRWLVGLMVFCFLTVGALAAGPKFPDDYTRRDAAYEKAITGNGDEPVLNHLPYKSEPEPAALNTKPELWGVDRRSKPRLCQLLPEPKKALIGLLAYVNAQKLDDGRKLFAYSCYRRINDQIDLFCSADGHPGWCRKPEDRAKSSAPSRYSEHATGYTLDFTTCKTVGLKNTPSDCGELTEDFAGTSAGQVLATVAGQYGFELSFPCAEFGITIDGKQKCKKTRQGVTYEPWHWRWVGANGSAKTTEDLPAGAVDARKIFARARKCFAAVPGIDPVPLGASETDLSFECPPPYDR
ncbi:D-alanyl-D-alanine carboxypeptidase family protein [Sphingomonas bacterium]|uniref:D-alanyl-D-alanine carboxypeptidase family protein n=1 Tax=Sphingomonas bacterium TaxID=1895847 RepID=UPI0026381781|nr:D-alanyl-D-alanine carboxypeptidase family protein [Sphingomonas bacterium]MDB5678740.1 D-alanyl-D-alanine carboxypeptidase [Sphingomonas bacterium]